MKTTHNKSLVDFREEQKMAKQIAIEDVMRSVRLLNGWGQYPEFTESPGSVFDKYHEMSIEELHNEKERLECLANEYVQSLHPVIDSTNNITRLLRDDEQDFED